jgi:hypothetical protein
VPTLAALSRLAPLEPPVVPMSSIQTLASVHGEVPHSAGVGDARVEGGSAGSASGAAVGTSPHAAPEGGSGSDSDQLEGQLKRGRQLLVLNTSVESSELSIS